METAGLVDGHPRAVRRGHPAAAPARRQPRQQQGRARPGAPGAADQAQQGRPHRDLRLVVQLLPVRLHRAGSRLPGARRSSSGRLQHRRRAGATSDEHARSASATRSSSGRSASPSSALLILAAFRAQDLPLIGGGDTYYAAFTEAGGLKANDEVRIAGVRVGKVESVELDGDHVKVELPGRRPTPSSATRPAPRSRSRRCSARCTSPCEPAGDGQLEEGAEIPVERTSSPFDVVEAFTGLAETSDARSTPTSSPQSLTTLADLTRNTPEEFRGGPRRRVRAVGEHRRPRRPDQPPAAEPASGCPRVLDDARPGHHRADARRRRAVPRAGRSAARRSTTCWSRPSTLSQELTALVAAEPRRPQAGADPPRERARRSSTRTRTTWTTACG